MIRPRYLAGFTGHRDIADQESLRQALATELAGLKARIHQQGGVLELYTSAAYGGDTVACEEAERLGIPVHVILPKPVVLDPVTQQVDQRRGFAADFWRGATFMQAEWDRTHRLIQSATSGANGGTLRVALGSQTEPECYYEAGVQMLESVDVLLAVWDHQPARGLGGTEHLVTLAEKRQLPLIIIPPIGGAAKHQRLDRLGAANDESRKIFADLESFSYDCRPKTTVGGESAKELFHALETCSGKHSKFFRLSLLCTILWHGAATLVAAVAAILPQTALPWKVALAALAALELSLVVAAHRRSRRLHHDRTHERWMESRFAAEIMRSMYHSAGLLDPLHPLIARHQPHWRRFAVTAGLMIRRETPAQDWQSARQDYVSNRLRHPDPALGQIAYFTQKQAAAEPIFKSTHWWGSKLGSAAILFVMGALLFKLYVISAKLAKAPYPATVGEADAGALSWLAAICFSLLPIALPLAAGISISLRNALDSGRRTYRYKELAERLTAAAAALETLQTETAVRRTVAYTEEVLLDELLEWHLAEQQNGAH